MRHKKKVCRKCGHFKRVGEKGSCFLNPIARHGTAPGCDCYVSRQLALGVGA